MLEYLVLGPFEVRRDGATVDLGGYKQRALLARLVLAGGHVVSSDRLIDDLWAGAPPSGAAGTMQTYISHLRRALEPDRSAGTAPSILVTRAPGYVLTVGDASVDATAFESETAEAAAALAAGDPAEAGERFARALARWRGEALADVAGEPWAMVEAGRLEELRQQAVEGRMDAVLAAGRHREAVAELEALVGAEPLRERRRAQLVLALYRSGRQADALRAYGDGRELLVEELGLEPGPELQRLEQLVLAQSPELDWRPSPGAGRPALGRPAGASGGDAGDDPTRSTVIVERTASLIGRQPELAELERALATAASGSGRLALVAGEAGIGKTRLVDELAGRARARGALVLEGRGYEGEGTPAYWPWLQALRPALSLEPERVAYALKPGAVDLAQLMPEVKELVEVAAPTLDDPGTARFRLADAIATFLARMAEAQPVMVVLDDLHWSDPASLFVLRFVAGSLRNAAVLLVGTYRPDERHEPLAETLASLAGSPALVRVGLGGLGPDAVGRVLEASLAGTAEDTGGAAARLAVDVHARTGGNPFFVQEVARSLERAGPLGQERALAAVPEGVRDVLERRLVALPVPTREVLAVAAVAGRAVDLRLLEALSDDALEHLEPALVDGVVHPVDGSLARLRFVHDLLRETVLARLPPVRLARLHGQVGRALLRLGDRQLDELAEHFWAAAHAGCAEEAFETALGAADQALPVFAFERADEHLQRALALLDNLPPSPVRDERELRVQARIGRLWQRMHGVSDPRVGDALQRVRVLARTVGIVPEVLPAAWYEWGFHIVRNEPHAARAIAQELIDHGSSSGEPGFAAMGWTALGNTLHQMGDHEGARQALERGATDADATPGLASLVEMDIGGIALSFLIPVLETLDEHDAALDLARRVRARFARRERAYDFSHGLLCITWADVLAGDAVRARASAEDLVAVGERFPFYSLQGEVFLAWAKATAGDPDADRQLIERVRDCEESDAVVLRSIFLGLLADRAAATGRVADALAHLDGGLADAASTGGHFFDPELHRRRGVLLAALGDRREEGVVALRTAVEVARASGARRFERAAQADLDRLGERAAAPPSR